MSMMNEYMKQITNEGQFDEALHADKISVFTFSAQWCPDCRFIEPFMQNVVEKFSDYDFYYVDRDQHIELCQRLMVMGIPSFVVVGHGEEKGRFVSKLRKTQTEIEAFLENLK